MQHPERLSADVQWHNLSKQLDTEQEHEQRLAVDRNRQMERRDVRWNDQLNCGFSYNTHNYYKQGSHIGQMSIICSDYKALKFKGESKGLCCSSEKVILSPITDTPEPIKSLLYGTIAQLKVFFNQSEFITTLSK